MNWGNLIVDVEPAGTVTLRDMMKTFAGGCDHSIDSDAAYDRALEVAGKALETYLDRIIAKREVTEYFEHHFGTVELHNMPVDTTADLTVWFNGEASTTGWDVYLYRGQTAFLTRIGHRWDMPMDWRHFDQANVTYTAGYDPIPSDLANAIVYTANVLIKADGSGATPGGASGDVKSMTIFDVGSLSYDVGSSSSSGSGWSENDQGFIPDVAASMVSAYRRMSV